MYLGLRQYQLHFDLAGLGILGTVLVLLGILIWQVSRGRRTTSVVLTTVLLSLCVLQFFRGSMVTEAAWLTMLGTIETSGFKERDQRVQELSVFWNTDVETMRAVDWYSLSNRWNVCHALWKQTKCNNPIPSEQAVGVARELLNGMVGSIQRPRGSL